MCGGICVYVGRHVSVCICGEGMHVCVYVRVGCIVWGRGGGHACACVYVCGGVYVCMLGGM